MKKALLVCYRSSQFTSMMRIARILKQSKRYKPIFFFAWKNSLKEEKINLCKNENIACFDYYLGKPIKSLSSFSQMIEDKSIIKRLLGFAKVFLHHIFLLVGLLDGILYYLKYLRRAHKVIKEQNPDILILSIDNVVYGSAMLIKAAHKERVPSVIVPFTIANAREPAEKLFNDSSNSLEKRLNRFVGFIYPKWVYEYNGRKMLRLPAPQVLMMEWLGLAPPLPWMMNSGFADAIAVESEFMMKYYIREGLPVSKLVFTGSLADDMLMESTRNDETLRHALYIELGLPVNRPMILCSLPPVVMNRPGFEFSSNEEMVKFWISTFAAIENYNIVISLHPSLNHDDVLKTIDNSNVKIVQEDIIKLIPLCDIFVASMSATIRWAIACGKPVVNYDIYKYRYNDYMEAHGVLSMEEKGDFINALHRLEKDPAFYTEIVNRQIACMKTWGQLDGQAASRMLSLFDQLISGSVKDNKEKATTENIEKELDYVKS